MGKRGPPPEGTPYEDLLQSLRDEIERAMDSAADESTSEIYNRFGLSRREVSWHAFRRIVSKRRKERTGEPTVEAVSAESLSDEALDRRIREYLAERLNAGNIKPYEMVGFWSRLFDSRRVKVIEEADARAQALFDEKMTELRARQAKADQEAARELRSEGLSDDAINRIRDIYGLARPDESDLSGEGTDGG